MAPPTVRPRSRIYEVRRLPGCKRRLEFAEDFLLPWLDELDVLAGFLLEGGNDIGDRFVLLGIEALLPPDHEVGALGAKRRHREHRGENRSPAPHIVVSPVGRTASISSLPVPDNVHANLRSGAQVSGFVKSASGLGRVKTLRRKR
jgi:hypothetical protein